MNAATKNAPAAGKKTKPAAAPPAPPADTKDDRDAISVDTADLLSKTAIGSRLSMHRMSQSRALNKDQKAEAAEVFGADADALSASKRLLDSKHPAIKAVNSVLNGIDAYWKSCTLPLASLVDGDSLEPGLRLMRRDKIVEFQDRMLKYQAELAKVVVELQAAMPQIKAEAKERLKDRLYNDADYPDDVKGLFKIHWSYPDVNPPSYLQQLSPDIYKQECKKVAERFQDTVGLAQATFLESFTEMVTAVLERTTGVKELNAHYTGTIKNIKVEANDTQLLVIEVLDGTKKLEKTQKIASDFLLKVDVGDEIAKDQVIGVSATGKPKVFRDSLVGNLVDQISYFRQFAEILGCSKGVWDIVDKTEEALKSGLPKSSRPKEGVTTAQHATMIAEELRGSSQFRENLKNAFGKLNEQLESEPMVRIRRRLGVNASVPASA